MSQVIIYQNPDENNVCVCVPSNDTDINLVLANDCPAGAVIIDSDTLPQGSDAEFFNAWQLTSDNTVTVNISIAQQLYLKKYNAAAAVAHQTRATNSGIGLTNTIDDATWTSNVVAGRVAILATTTTSDLLAIDLPTDGGTT